ncbi:MAG: phosphoglucomutase/phosphomannomutase family protein [Deferrisomatales bacterium]
MQIRFGTDGWRGVISRDFTFDNLRRVAAAIGAYLEGQGAAGRGVALGYDRRFLSEAYAAEVAGVLAARGIGVRLAAGPTPTPAVSWAVRHLGLAAGVVITASHNPPEWNGVKLKEAFGGPARPSVSREVERCLDHVPPGDRVACLDLEPARRQGLVTELRWWDGYRRDLGRLVDFELLRSARLTVAVDAMHGAGSPWLRRLLEDAGCRVVELRPDANPGFGGVAPEPVEANLGGLLAAVSRQGCHLGLANDGDADRIGAVDERGRYFSSQRILAVLLRYLREEKGLGGCVAKAVSGTSMLDLLAAGYGLEVVETPIGFKHAAEVMLEREVLVGGEESGGIGVGAHLPERDGLLNALLLAELVARTGQGLRAYLQGVFDRVGHFDYDRLDLRLGEAEIEAARARVAALAPPDRLAGRAVVRVGTLDGTKFVRDDASWLLVRPSGTEPLLRIYAEARTRPEVDALLAEGRRLAGCP